MRELNPADVALSEHEIGQGGRYRIVRALCDGEDVAAKSVKNIREQDARMTDHDLAREHGALERLDHPAIPRTRGLWRDPATGILHHIMEFRPGRPLQSIVTACVEKNGGRGARSWLDDTTTDIFAQAFGALAHAHSRSVIHNDVTPRNIHVHLADDGELSVSLIDFEASGDGDRGSVPYTAPERLEGQPGTVQSDVYSAAVLVFFVLSGVEPWPTRDATEALKERRASRLNDLPDDVSRGAWRLIREQTQTQAYVLDALLKATALDPKDRQASMRQFMRELQLSSGDPPPRRQPVLAWTGAVLAVLALLLFLPTLRHSIVGSILRNSSGQALRCRDDARQLAAELCALGPTEAAAAACRARLVNAADGLPADRCALHLAALRRAQTVAGTH